MEAKLDKTDREIIRLLAENGRITFAEIGRQVGLSLPAASERVRRMEESGIIEGYRAKISLKKIGYPTLVFVLLTIPASSYDHTKRQLSTIPEVLEVHHVAGELSLILKLRLAALDDLEPILLKLNRQGQSQSVIVLSTVVENDGIALLGDD